MGRLRGITPSLVGMVVVFLTGLFVFPAHARGVDIGQHFRTKVVGGYLVGDGGDVNGDMSVDLLVSRGYEQNESVPGTSWLLLGAAGQDRRRIDLRDGDGREVLITGARPGDAAQAVSAAGDVNADGFSDIIVGAPGADNNERTSSGTAYVVFGGETPEDIVLSDLDGSDASRGFRIDGARPGDLAGKILDFAGDVNGDGFDDVIVGAPFSGAAYVVYGSAQPRHVDLALLDPAVPIGLGYRIDVETPKASNGMSVAGLGDFNGDGKDDVGVGVVPRTGSRGFAHLVSNPSGEPNVDTSSEGSWGFTITGSSSFSSFGWSIDGAGDMDGDGLDDVAIGAPELPFGGLGRVYVIYGSKETASFEAWRRDGRITVLRGQRNETDELGAGAGVDVAGLGDVNGDGLADLSVGSDLAENLGRFRAGAVNVVYGSAERREEIGLRRPKGTGFKIVGADDYHGLGQTAFLGDVDSDGLADIFIGASGVGGKPTFGDDDPGASYVLLGR